jgi:hypothetical protein
MRAIRQNRTSKGVKGQEDRQVRRLATTFMSLVIVVALWATGCSTFESGQTQTEAKPVVGSTHQNHALKVRIDSLCWSWKSEIMPINGETGAFSIEVEATIKNEGKCKLHPPHFSVGGGGGVSGYLASRQEDIVRGNECKLRIANRNQVHLEFNNNDPGKEILLTVAATDQWGELYGLRITLPPPLEMTRCRE